MDELSRRRFVALSGLAVSVTACGGLGGWTRGDRQPPATDPKPAESPKPASEFFLTWQTLAAPAGVVGVAGIGQGGNTLVVASKGEAVLIDCKNLGVGALLRREAEKNTASKLRTVINTHHHADHTGGNSGVAAGGLTLIAHAKAKPRIEGQLERYVQAAGRLNATSVDAGKPGAEALKADYEAMKAGAGKLTAKDFAPTQTIDKDTDMEVGGVKYRLMHVGPGHTDNDMFVFFPDANLLHTGDLFFNRMHPVIDANAGATTLGWIASVKKMISLCNARTVVVPGHGDMSDAKVLQAQIDYFERAREMVGKAIKEGKTVQDVEGMEIPGTEGFGGGNRRQTALRIMFNELKGG